MSQPPTDKDTRIDRTRSNEYTQILKQLKESFASAHDIAQRLYNQGKIDGLSNEVIRKDIETALDGVVKSRQLRNILPLELKRAYTLTLPTDDDSAIIAESKRKHELEVEKMLKAKAEADAKAEETRIYRQMKRIEAIAREVPCNTKGCGKMITVYDEYTAAYAMCEEHKPNEEKARYEKYQQVVKHRSEVNPLIRYYHDINNIAKDWEIPFEMEQKRIEEMRKRDLNVKPKQITGPLDKFSDWDFTISSYKNQIPYDPSSGMSEEEWWKQVERKRLEIKERKADFEFSLRNNPTWQVLDKLRVVGSGCRCKTELMRQGQFCPVCRLMVKVHEYALRLFKDAAEGRGIGGDMSITR